MTDNNTTYGHNESAVRLGILADTAQRAHEGVATNEDGAINGWLAFGAALNEARGLCLGDREFGRWLADNVLGQLAQGEIEPKDQQAAMWAAANRDDFDTARAAGNARTVRGIHSKWQEIDAERKAADERAKAETERAKADAERKIADEANRKAEAERLEAKAQADVEAEALAAVKRAKNAEQRRIAQEQADVAAAAKAEAEATARAEDEKAKAAGRLAKAADKAAKAAGKSAKAAEKKAAKAKAGDTSADAGTNHLAIGTGENEWYTPNEYAEMARKVMGDIDLDPASSKEANEVIKAAVYFTKEDDGLSHGWKGRVWLNPPYSRDFMFLFCEKLASHFDAGDVTAAILVSHNNTDTRWFHRLGKSCAAMCFPKQRIRFYRGDDIAAPVNGQVFFYFGSDVGAFRDVFEDIGLVVYT